MAAPFDPNQYTRAPVLDVPSAYSLGVALLSAVPKGADRGPLIRAAARALRASVVVLRDAWSASIKHGVPDRRAIDVVADASWRSMSFALLSKTLLSGTPEHEPKTAAAKTMHARLFPAGLQFTQGTFTSQWAEADRMLNDLDGDALGPKIDALIGKEHLAFVRRAHAAHGDALKITEAAEEAPAGVREPLRAVQVAIQEYVFALFSQHRPSDPKNHGVLRTALLPIDEQRAQASRTSPTSAAPVPVPPAVTPPAPVIEPGPEPVGPPPDGPIPDIE